MREIKYRVWNEELEEMYVISKEKYLGSTGIVDPYIGHEKAVWMQFTGLTDVNGRDIYGGDICEYQDGEYSFIAIIESDYVNWYLKGISPKDNFDINDYHDCGKSCLKVIGNIFQDKDLLKENEK